MTAAVVSLSHLQYQSRRPSHPRKDALAAIVAVPECTTSVEAPAERTRTALRVVGDRAAERAEGRAAAEAFWPDYWLDRSTDVRDALVLSYSSLVHAVIAHLPRGMRASWSSSDLQSFGMVGLLEAIDRFEVGSHPGRFPAYAMLRIRGAIVDEVRRADWLPRAVRSRATAYRTTEEELCGRFGRQAHSAEVIAAMGLHPSRGAAIRKEADARIVELDLIGGVAKGTRGTAVEVADDGGREPEQQLLDAELIVELRDAVSRLPERQRMVVTMRYLEGKSQCEIGELIGVSNSRICQIEAAALKALKRTMLA